MKYKFIEGYQSLSKRLSDLKAQYEQVLVNQDIKSREDLTRITDQWQDEVEICIKENVAPFPENLVEQFKYRYLNRYDDAYSLYRSSSRGDIVKGRLKSLKILEGYFLVLNSLTGKEPQKIQLIQEKMDYVMEKLYLVFNDNNCYSIENILDLSGIEYRSDEPRELAKDMRKKEFISVEANIEFAKLSVKGASYVERKRKSTVKRQSQRTEEELNKKVDIVLEKLQSLGYGQEIIFEEIEELKSLSGKLSKKTWVQLLKVKIIDLAMEQVINKETASYILETFTEEASRLLPK